MGLILAMIYLAKQQLVVSTKIMMEISKLMKFRILHNTAFDGKQDQENDSMY